ncbi:MAG: hypothetical protein P8L66_13950 [Rhodospirillaceae bacterium]|nr:hypothetical protein [Rhodospirillaceae bacterium]
MELNLCGTQTGRLSPVKKNGYPQALLSRVVATIALIGCLGACAYSLGGWRQSTKNEAMTRADYAVCKERAEDATLIMRRADRQGYGTAGTERPGTFNPRGDDPMAISERSDASSLYDSLIASCMTRKGYRQPGDT